MITYQDFSKLKEDIEKNYDWVVLVEMDNSSMNSISDKKLKKYLPNADWEKVYFNSEEDNYKTDGASGFCSCFINKDDKKSVIVIDKKLDFTVKFLLLLHELGHAVDHKNEVNFKIKLKQVDIINAEYFAHRFVIQECNKRNAGDIIEYYKSIIVQYPCPEWELKNKI